MHQLVYPAAQFFDESVAEDRAVGMEHLFGNVDSFYKALSNDSRLSVFDHFMKAVTGLNQARVASLADINDRRRIVDVGGSTGSMALTLARCQPRAEITVFDFPGVVQIAEQRFQESEARERLHAIGGNIIEEDIPRGFDCILYCHFCGVFSEERNRENVRKAYDALEPGGLLCIYTPVIGDEEDGPLATGVFSSYFLFLANGKGRFYNAARITSWMSAAGFRKIAKRSLPAYEAVFLGYK